MAATLKVINSKVGEGGQKSGAEVRRVLQLLARAKYLPPSASLTTWSNAAAEACKAFHQDIGFAARTEFDPAEKSDALLELCKKANVVLPLKLGTTGAQAFLAFWTAAVDRNVPYCWSGMKGRGEDRVAYGFHDYEDYLVFTSTGAAAPFDPDPKKPGIGMNCISFVNLALSIWRKGCAHTAPYDASQEAGGFTPISARYSMPAIRCPGANASSFLSTGVQD